MEELTCIYCKKSKTDFNKEHIIPITFGGYSKYLENLVCSDCNNTFSKEFEGRFLKGSGIESFLRAIEGKKGRRNYPVFGDGSYGNRVLVTINANFPPIQLLISKQNVWAPIQLIGITNDGNHIHSIYEEDSFEGNIQEFLESLWNEIRMQGCCSRVFLWIRDTDVTVSNYRLIKKEFYRWLGKNSLDGGFFCDQVIGFPVRLDWETIERQRMFAKMSLNFLFWLYPERDVCLQKGLDEIRNFILTGEGDGEKIVLQWVSNNNPFLNTIGIDYDIAVGIFQQKDNLFGGVYIPKIGMFLVSMGNKITLPDQPMREGIQTFIDRVCLFLTATNGNPLFCIIDQRKCLKIRDQITNDPYFRKFFHI